MPQFTRNHFIPQWFQHRFIPPARKEKKFYYLDLQPEIRVSNGRRYTRNALMRWGPPRCFCLNDLYTRGFGDWKSTEIEEKFFGPIDRRGQSSRGVFRHLQHPSADGDHFHAMLPYMSIQKIRTPKGLAESPPSRERPQERSLDADAGLQRMFCTLWTECVWSIADASKSPNKVHSLGPPDNGVQRVMFPGLKVLRDHTDPDIWLSGTHTIFPLSLDKVLILTNLSWVRDPYGNPLKSATKFESISKRHVQVH